MALQSKVSELDTSMVDQMVEREEAMDWDDVDPGILEELQLCRRTLREKGDASEEEEEEEGTLTKLNLANRSR